MSHSHVFILCDVNSLLPLNIFEQRLAWLSALAICCPSRCSHCQISPWRWCDDKVPVYLLFAIFIVFFRVKNMRICRTTPGTRPSALRWWQFSSFFVGFRARVWLLRKLFIYQIIEKEFCGCCGIFIGKGFPRKFRTYRFESILLNFKRIRLAQIEISLKSFITLCESFYKNINFFIFTFLLTLL